MEYRLPENLNLSPCSLEMTRNCLFFNAILIINHTGNSVAGFILCDLRMRTKAHGEAHGIRA